MKRNNSILIGIIVIIVLVVAGYAIFHKSSKTTPTSSSSSSQKAAAVNNAVLTTKTDSKLGQYLADPTGKALYTYNSDTTGVSNCTGSCLTNWPPYVDNGSTSNLPAGVGTIKRGDNGRTQYTYNGMPLYYFVSDSAGHVTGNGIDNFSVAKPSTTSSSSSSSSSSSPSSSTPSQSNSNSSSSTYNY